MSFARAGHLGSGFRPSRACLLGTLVATTLALTPTLAAAETPAPNAARQEARQRFDMGLAVYDAGDFEGALAEFQRAYELTGHPVVLYNIGLVEARLGHPAQSVEAFERLLEGSATELDPERLARARATHAEQLARLGTLRVRSNVDDVALQLDGIDVTAPPSEPIRVKAGVHIVSLFAPGYAPRHAKVVVARQREESVELELEPLEQQLARLELRANVDDVDVSVDGLPLGKTPLTSTLTFRPGRHRIALRRAGYDPIDKTVELHPGSTGSLNFELNASTRAPAEAVGNLVLQLSEANAVVLVDGQPNLDFERGLRLPRGRHRLLVKRDGFYDVARDVTVLGETKLALELLPRPEYLRSYVESANTVRTWGWLATGTGAAVTGAATTFLIWNLGEEGEAASAFDTHYEEVRAGTSQSCMGDDCDAKTALLLGRLKDTRDRYLWVSLGLGVGVATLGTGIIVLATGDDPKRYEPNPESDVFGSLRLGVGDGVFVIDGRF